MGVPRRYPVPFEGDTQISADSPVVIAETGPLKDGALTVVFEVSVVQGSDPLTDLRVEVKPHRDAGWHDLGLNLGALTTLTGGNSGMYHNSIPPVRELRVVGEHSGMLNAKVKGRVY